MLVIAGAVIGAISAGAGQVVTNLASGKKWNEGLGTAMLIGGVTGLIPGAGKALGTVGSKVAGKFGTARRQREGVGQLEVGADSNDCSVFRECLVHIDDLDAELVQHLLDALVGGDTDRARPQ